MRKAEYGSDFAEKEPYSKFNNFFENEKVYEFLLGRTALDAIIQDALSIYAIKKVLLPSYCCHTMIEPFIRHNIDIAFYDIVVDEGGLKYCIDTSLEYEAILVMQYFGFHSKGYYEIIDDLKSNGKIVIEDITHSLLFETQHSGCSDYIFGSYRKWMSLCGGAIAKRQDGNVLLFRALDESDSLNEFLSLKKEAFELKRKFFERGGNGEKHYLKKFSDAEKIIEKNYSGYMIDGESKEQLQHTNFDEIKRIRRKNARILIERLKQISGIELVYDSMDCYDVPLFVPICVKDKKRQQLRQFLISENIYLPVHWPKSGLHQISYMAEKIYDEELSVICDQRYNEEDMLFIADKIEEWSKQNVGV